MVDTGPLLCECAEETRVEIVMLHLDTYHDIRSDPCRFVLVPGRERTSEDAHMRVVLQGGRHVVVEKVGDAGRRVEELAEES